MRPNTQNTHTKHTEHTQSPGVLWIKSTNHRNQDQTRNSPTNLTFETMQHHLYLFYPEDLTRILFQKSSNLQGFGGIPFHALLQPVNISPSANDPTCECTEGKQSFMKY